MNSRYKTVVTDLITTSVETEIAILGDIAEVHALNAQSEEELVGHIEDADTLMVYHLISLTKKTMERLEKCKLIVRCGVGYDNVDYALARRHGIAVANVPDYGTEEVADSAIGLALAMMRGIVLANSRLRGSGGEPWTHQIVAPLLRLRGRIFGIVGLGRIGTAVAVRARSLGMEVVYYDPYKPDGYDKSLGIRRAESLEELLEQTYVVSMHCPLTVETRHMINGKAISKMQDGSYLVNTARGGVVNVRCIVDAIASGRLAGAAIDVLEDEPPDDDNPLITAWRDPNHPAHHRVLVNPHLAFYCEEGCEEVRAKAAETCRRAMLGLSIPNVIN